MRLPARLSGRVAPWAAAAACAVAALWLASESKRERSLERANAAGLRADYKAAIREAGAARTGPTTAGRANAVQGYAWLQLGRFRDAARSFDRALRSNPSDWRLRRDLAQTLVILGDDAAAREQIRRALSLNPRMPLPGLFRRAADPDQE
ncbi:MAG: tetratricopeptide repeat protein [Solirubrobacteraceae bacterium]